MAKPCVTRALAAYMTGETDSNAAWTWGTLTITSRVFDLDKLTGRMVNGGIEVDYVWHNNDTNQLNRQSCAFANALPFPTDESHVARERWS